MQKDLPKVENKKLINVKEFTKLAKKVGKSFEEELDFIKEKREKNGNNNSHRIYSCA